MKISILRNRIFIAVLDLILLYLSLYLTIWAANSTNIIGIYHQTFISFLGIFIFYIFGFYKEIIRFFSPQSILIYFGGVLVYSFISLIVIYGNDSNFLKLFLINFLSLFALITVSRLLLSFFLLFTDKRKNIGNPVKERVLIYGAGEAGRQIATSIHQNPDYKLLGFADDAVYLQKRKLFGVPIIKNSSIKRQIKTS